MIKRITLLLTALLTFTAVTAQRDMNATQLIDKVIETMQHADGVTAAFTLRGDDRTALYLKGELKMKGKQFYLHTDDMSTWYDGKTMWSYAKAIGEVNVTQPTQQELIGINPYYTLRSYKQMFDVTELQSSHTGERRLCLIPSKRNTAFSRIVVTIATATLSPIAFEITDTNQMTTTITITDYDARNKLPDATFTFDASQYPDVDVIDLR